MQSYVESLINLINAGKLSVACEEVGMCFKTEHNGLVQMTGMRISVHFVIGTAINIFFFFVESGEVNKPDHLVGANRCTYGPSYWCETEDQMDECNTREYCVSYKLKLQAKAASP